MSSTPGSHGTSTGPSPKKMIMIVLGLVGGVVVLGVGAAMVYYAANMAIATLGSSSSVTFAAPVATSKRATGTSVNTDAREAAMAFMSELLAGQVDRAHGMASQDFQREVQNVDLRAQYEGTPQLRKGGNLQLVVQKQTPQDVVFRGTVTGANGSVAFMIRVIVEDFEWKVGKFTLIQ